MKTSPPTRAQRAGFTLIESATVCAMVGVLAAAAIPSYQSHQLRMARLDAVQALSRVQAAQEQHLAAHGLYASDLSALRGVTATSAQGRYTIALSSSGAEAYRATASASGVQLQDRACPALTLDVAAGFASAGPSPACWNR